MYSRRWAGLAVSAILCGCGAVPHPGPTPPGPVVQHTSTTFGPQYARAAHCGDLTAADAPNFFIISGTRVVLPRENPLSSDATIVQPGSFPIAHFGIGVNDGTGTCAVYMPNPPVAVGGYLTVVVQAVRSTGGGVWFGGAA